MDHYFAHLNDGLWLSSDRQPRAYLGNHRGGCAHSKDGFRCNVLGYWLISGGYYPSPLFKYGSPWRANWVWRVIVFPIFFGLCARETRAQRHDRQLWAWGWYDNTDGIEHRAHPAHR